jgi:hypothetical protein
LHFTFYILNFEPGIKENYMKTIARLSFLVILSLFISSCAANKKLSEPASRVFPLSDTAVIRDGSIVYGLPRTVFSVDVIAERTIEIPGPYASYAGDLLGLDNVIQKEKESWKLKSINIRTHEELDPSEFYIIQSSSIFQTNVLALRKEGLILDLNPALLSASGNYLAGTDQEITRGRTLDLGSDEYFQQQNDTAYKRVNIDSSFIRIPYILEKKKKLNTDQLAERAAKRLMEMRDGKHLILTGEANVFPQSDAPIIEMNRLESEYTELFAGKTSKEVRKFSYQIIPEKEMAGKPTTLFWFSELKGSVAGTVKDGIPVTVYFIPEHKTKNLTIIAKNQLQHTGAGFDKLYYRVPDVVNIRISLGNEFLFNSRKLVYQFGEVVQLPENYLIGK